MGKGMIDSKNKMTVSEFWMHHVRYYDASAIAEGVVGVQAITLQGQTYVELIQSDDEAAAFLNMAEIEKKLLGLPDDLYVVMIDPEGWCGEHEYVIGSSGGSDEIMYHCGED